MSPDRRDMGFELEPWMVAGDHEAPWQGRHPVRILTGVDARAVIEVELDRLEGG